MGARLFSLTDGVTFSAVLEKTFMLALTHLDEAVRLVDRARAAVGREGEVADVVRDALVLELVLALAHRGDLRGR